MNITIEIYNEGSTHCAYISDDCGGSGIEVQADNYDDFAKEVGLYVADYSFKDEDDYTDEQYDECWNILSQCVANEQVSADDEIDDILYELLEFVEGWERMTDEEQDEWGNAMMAVWRNFDEW